MDLIIVIITTILVLLLMVDYKLKPKQGNVLPYRIPIIGHVFLLYGKDIHKALSELSEKYGNVYTLQILHKHIIVLNEYEAIHEGLVLRGKALGGRLRTFRLNYVLHGKDLVFQDICPRWKRLRHMVHSHIRNHNHGVDHIEKIVFEISADLVKSLKEKCEIDPVLDPNDDVYLAATNTISLLLAGHKYEIGDPLFKKWVHTSKFGEKYVGSLNGGWELDIFPWLRYFGNSTFKKVNEFVTMSKELFEISKETKLDGDDDEEHVGLALALIRELSLNEKTPDDQVIDEDTVRLVILDIMGAGILTSSSAINAFLQIISADKDIQIRMYSEIRNTLRNTKDTHISIKHRGEMPYTRACVEELLRYVTPTVFGSPHVAMEDTKIGNLPVYKGEIVLNNLWKIHHDPKYWSDPWVYKPERFLDADGNFLPSDHIIRKRLLAFGAGPRACIGQTFALVRLFIVFTSLVQNFEIQSVNLEDRLHDPRNYLMEGLLTPKRNKIKFIIRK